MRELERSLRFYRDLLGIPLEREDRDWAEATFPDGTRFALHAAHEGVGELSSGTVRVDFEVADADAARERLRGEGVEARDAMREEWGAVVEVIDPDGYLIHLYQPA